MYNKNRDDVGNQRQTYYTGMCDLISLLHNSLSGQSSLFLFPADMNPAVALPADIAKDAAVAIVENIAIL